MGRDVHEAEYRVLTGLAAISKNKASAKNRHRDWLPDEPRISVVVPFYGSDVSALKRCVESLLDQDYARDRVSIIVVDNNETAILPISMFQGRCKLFHDPFAGSYAARNRGIRESSDDVIAFTDSDCVAQRSWISAGVRALKEAAGPTLVGGPIVFSFGGNIPESACELLDRIIHHRQSEYIFEHGFAATANLFVPRVLICSYGGFDTRFLSGGDREFGQRLTARGIKLVMAEDAVIVHPARTHFVDLLQKGLRGVGGEKMALDLRNSPAGNLFKIQVNNYLHRQRLISRRAVALGMTSYQAIKIRALLTLIYVARFYEAIRLVFFGGEPRR